MTGNGQDTTADLLNLQSQMSELSRVPVWVEGLASRYSIPADTQFAIDLCLEEVLSNIIRHGCSGEQGHFIAIQFSRPRPDYFAFVVQDDAQPFNPLDKTELPALNPRQEAWVGGQGIRLLRRFADALEYQPTPIGNRLSIGFSAARSSIAKD